MSKIISYLKNLWNNGALYIIIGSFATKFATLFGSIFIVRLMSKDEYGLLCYMENLYSFVVLIAGLGLSNAALRYVVLGKTMEEKQAYYDYILKRSLIYNLIIMFVVILVNYVYPHPSGFEDSKYLLAIMLVMLPFQYLIDINLGTERALFQNKRFSIISFLVATFIVIGKIVGAFIGGIESVILASVIVNVIFSVITYCSLNKRYFFKKDFEKISKIQKKEINVYSLQYMITNGLWTLFMLLDVFLLSQLGASKLDIADYKIAYVWPANIGIIGSCIAIYITPYFVKNENDKAWIKRNFFRTYTLNLIITLIIAGGVFILSKPLIWIYAGSKYMNTIPLMRIILIGSIINNGLRMITANTLAAMGKVKYNMIVSFVGVIMQIGLNILLIPQYGVFAVAYTSIIVYMFMAITLLIIFTKYYLIEDKG